MIRAGPQMVYQHSTTQIAQARPAQGQGPMPGQAPLQRMVAGVQPGMVVHQQHAGVSGPGGGPMPFRPAFAPVPRASSVLSPSSQPPRVDAAPSFAQARGASVSRADQGNVADKLGGMASSSSQRVIPSAAGHLQGIASGAGLHAAVAVGSSPSAWPPSPEPRMRAASSANGGAAQNGPPQSRPSIIGVLPAWVAQLPVPMEAGGEAFSSARGPRST
ncbi:unnamed protein product, partial [Polarella glacialis]